MHAVCCAQPPRWTQDVPHPPPCSLPHAPHARQFSLSRQSRPTPRPARTRPAPLNPACHAPPAPACPPALALACLSPAVVCPGCECAKLAVCLVPPTHRPACADISRDGPRPAWRRALVGTATPAAANLHRSPLALPASSHHRPLRRQLVPSSPSLLRLSRLVAACWAFTALGRPPTALPPLCGQLPLPRFAITARPWNKTTTAGPRRVWAAALLHI